MRTKRIENAKTTMKSVKSSGIRNTQKINATGVNADGDGTATRKMIDNLGQVGAGVARVTGKTALGTAQSVAAAPGAIKKAIKQRKDDVDNEVSRRLGSRLGLRKDDPETKEKRREKRIERIGKLRGVATKKREEKREAGREAAREVARQKVRDRIAAARDENKNRGDKMKNLSRTASAAKRGGALAVRPSQRVNTNQNVPSPPKALLRGTKTERIPKRYAKRPTGTDKVGVASSGGTRGQIRSKGGPIGRDGSQGRSLPARAQGVPTIRTDMNVPYSKPSSPKGRVDVASSGGIRSKGGAIGRDGSQGRSLSAAKTRAAREDGLAKAASSRSVAGKPDAQRARRDPEYRRKLIQQREEFIYEVENMKKEKVDKVIDIMRGKNKIEVNPKVNESHLLVQDLADYKPLEIETIDLIKPEPLKASNWRNEISEEDKKIISINKGKRLDAKKQAFKDMVDEPYETDDKKRKEYGKKLLDRLTKVDEGAAWTKKEGKNKSGGLNEKGRKSYERENPGSDLKAPSKKVGNPRRKSFCARMRGMKKKLTSKKTASDPNSRINKSLRAWNC